MSRETASMKPVNEMSEQECRDEIAKAKGWEPITEGVGVGLGVWRHPEFGEQGEHPIVDDLDAAHDSLPEGVRWDSVHWLPGGRYAAVAVGRGPLAVWDSDGDYMRLAMLRASTAAHRAGKENA